MFHRAMIMAAVGFTLGTASAPGQSPAITPEISIDQDKLLSGDYRFREVVESGRHLFSTPFTKNDGHGEGGAPDTAGTPQAGPREVAFDQNFDRLAAELGISDEGKQKLRASLAFPFPGVNGTSGQREVGFLRLNGLDSQSCFECHNSIGSANQADTQSTALSRRVGVNGGPAGVASNAFINDELPYYTTKFIRNPPHVFGTGYVQALADEMSIELLRIKYLAIGEAVGKPNTAITKTLETKGVNFGKLVVTYKGAPDIAAMRAKQLALSTAAEEDDNFDFSASELVGISNDLFVRPLQWKGIATNERNFVKDALNFHFGLLAVEIQKEPDEDMDGVENEVSIGNVSALAIFTMSIRPPMQIIPPDQEDRVAHGEKLFATVGCAGCHVSSLRLGESRVTVHDPREEFKDNLASAPISLTLARKSSSDLPIAKQFQRIAGALKGDFESDENAGLKQLRAVASDVEEKSPQGYTFDLTMPPRTSLSFSYPRLTENLDGSIDVPLFSDLKRHKMGDRLADRFSQSTDAVGVLVPPDEFLTRPLWGLADTGPWLHDGRARSIEDAILLHDGNGSEAATVVAAFRELPTDDDRQAIVDFLLTLRLPPDPRYASDVKP